MSRAPITPATKVARYASRARAATTARDEAIVEARTAGLSLRAIAEAAGLSHSAIAKIVAKTTHHPPNRKA